MKNSGLLLDSRPALVEPSATYLLDSSRRQANGAFAATDKPDWVRLPSGLWIMRFNGTDATVSFTDSAYLNSFLTGSFTFCVWLYFNAIGSGSQQIFRKRDGPNGFSLYHDSTTYLSGATGNGSTSVYSSTYHLTTNFIWQLWTITYVASGSFYITFYANCVDKTTSHQTHALSAFPGSTLYLGSNNGASGFFNGDMALPRLFNYALTIAQIRSIFENERRWFGL